MKQFKRGQAINFTATEYCKILRDENRQEWENNDNVQ